MAEVRTKDVLLRVGGRTLHRTGVLAAAGAGRGYVELKETFTRAAVRRFRDRDGIGRKAAIDKVAIEYPGELSGLVDQFGYPYCGPRLNGARTQLVTDPENFGAWTIQGTPIRTSGQADPFGGTAAYLIEDNDAGVIEFIEQNVAFPAGTSTRCVAFFIRQGTSAKNTLRVFDRTALLTRHHVEVTWTGSVPTLATITGAGTLFTPVNWGGGWWIAPFAVDGVVGANTNELAYFPTALTASDVGTGYVFGANAWDVPFPSSYQGPGESAGAADSLTVPFNWGPSRNLTVLARMARLVHADASGDIVVFPTICQIGTPSPLMELFFRPNARLVNARVNGSGSDVVASIPAGTEIRALVQMKNLTTAPAIALDVGSGLGAFDTGSAAFTAWGNQTLAVGSATDSPLYGVLLDLIIMRGLLSLNEALAVP